MEVGAEPPRAAFAGFGHTSWTTRDGLPQNMIQAILQTRDGYLWLGTSNGGLVRFDGQAFTVFEATTTPGLPSNWISSLYEDADGTLWVGTGSGLVRYANGVFTPESFEDVPAHKTVAAIAADPSGRVWALSGGHVARRDTGRWIRISLAREDVTCFLPQKDGSVWIGTRQGLLEWRDGIVRTLTVADGLPDSLVQALYEDPAGQLWIGTARGLAFLGRDRRFLRRAGGPLSTASIGRFLRDRDGVMWIGAAGRLFTQAPDGRLAEHVLPDMSDAALVAALLEDREGHLWFGVIGSRGGLHRLRRHQVGVTATEQGLPCENVGPVTETHDGTVWAGLFCNPGGVVAFRDERMTRYAGPHHVSALLADTDGSLWAGDYDGNLFHLEGGRLVPHPIAAAGGTGAILALHRDSTGALWVGASRGLLREVRGEWRRFGERDGLTNDNVRSIVSGRDGTLWIGLGEGLAHYANERFTMYTLANGVPRAPVRALHVDAGGSVWIGTYGGGLCRLASRRIVCLGSQGGLLDRSVHRLIEDGTGALWMTGDAGIRRASLRQLESIADGKSGALDVLRVDESYGMKTEETNGMGQPAGWRTRDGLLWIPTQRGLARLDPATAQSHAFVPQPVIEATTVGGVPYPVLAPIEVQPGAGDLELRYTAPAFDRPELTHFRYRLRGYDAGWIDARGRRVAHYANLPPGTYYFELMARGSTGLWSAPVTSVAVTLAPRFHQRLAFRIALGLVLFAAALWAIRLRITQIRQRERGLESVVANRTAELCREREGLNAANLQLETARAALQASHTQLLAVLDQLSVGVIIVNLKHEVLFASAATRRLLVAPDDDVTGQPLERVLPIPPEVLAQVQALLRDPAPGVRVTAQLRPPSGQPCVAELVARPDPRDGRNTILYLYDVTETYVLERAKTGDESGGALSSLIGESVVMRFVRDQIRTLAAVDATVLIEGETGTGKELVARAIHESSRRKDWPFVAINCAGLTESLLASQLFGHRRGAFTGAVSDHVGLFEAAQGGTLLLDEIGDMPMTVQTHLLRVVQEREILRLGDSKPRPIDVRVLVATHRSLQHEVATGKFREDLLYRILVARIAVPPLRQRADDIPLLATAFLEQFCATHRKRIDALSREAMEHLMSLPWPGNVRELRAAIEWAVIRATGSMIRLGDLPGDAVHGDAPSVRSRIDEERRRLQDVLTRTGGNRSIAAKLLGVSRATLYRRLASLERDQTRPLPQSRRSSEQ